MPRIRSIKPDFWKDHHLATSLSRDARLLYIGMWNFADDHGVLEGPAERIKVEIFPYESINIRKLLSELIHSGRLIEYSVAKSTYFWLTKLNKHQKLDRPRDSNLPMPSNEIIENHLKSSEIISGGEGIGIGGDRDIGKIPVGTPTPILASVSNGWGTPEALQALYNSETPDELPAVTKLSPGRIFKAKAYLKAFPDQAFWKGVCQQIHRSMFLRGLKETNGRIFKADFDWLLTKGKDGSENCVKVYEGRYTDERRM